EPLRDMRLYTGPKERAFVQERLSVGQASHLPSLGMRDARPTGLPRYAVLAPTSRWPGKRWPFERFGEVSRWLLAHGMDTVAVVGAKHERSQCAPLLELAAAEPRVADLIGG